LRFEISISIIGYWSWSPKLRPDGPNGLLGQLHKIATENTCFGRYFLI